MEFVDIDKLTFKEAKEIVGLDRRFLGFSGLANFGTQVSSSRYVMFFGFLTQYVPLRASEPPIALTGLEREFGKTLFNRRVENDSTVLGMVSRYNGKSGDSVIDEVETFVLVLDHEHNELDFVNIPKHEKHSPKFGYELTETEELLNCEYGDLLPGGTVLARTPSDKGNDDVSFSVNAIGALVSDKRVGEDAIIVSESFAKKCSFSTYQTFKFSTGMKSIPVNIFGDDDNYKVIKDIGETLDDTILFATRKAAVDDNVMLYPALFSTKHLQCVDVMFDTVYNTNKARGKIVDIKVIRSERQRKVAVYTGIYDQLDRYADSYRLFMRTFIRDVENLKRMYPDVKLSRKLHAEMVHYRLLLDEKTVNYENKDPLDLYHIEVTVEFKHSLRNGMKVAGKYGNKAIVSGVIPDADMPITSYGMRVDYIMDMKSTAGRMNPGVPSEGSVGNISRETKFKIVDKLDSIFGVSKKPKELEKRLLKNTDVLYDIYDIILGLVKMVSEEQYRYYTENSLEDKIEIICETYFKELYLLIPMDGDYESIEGILYELFNSEYAPTIEPITYTIDGTETTTEEPVELLCSPLMVLSKIADTWLATSTAKVNHYGIPISTSRENRPRQPYTPNPVRTGEAESRLINAYVGPVGMATLRNRSVSVDTHRLCYSTIMTCDDPANIERLVPEEYGFPNDKPVEIFNSILEVGGVGTEYKEDLSDIYEED